jgi:hypothetical protein
MVVNLVIHQTWLKGSWDRIGMNIELVKIKNINPIIVPHLLLPLIKTRIEMASIPNPKVLTVDFLSRLSEINRFWLYSLMEVIVAVVEFDVMPPLMPGNNKIPATKKPHIKEAIAHMQFFLASFLNIAYRQKTMAHIAAIIKWVLVINATMIVEPIKCFL